MLQPQKILLSSQVICQVCGERERILVVDSNQGVYQCGNCSHVFTVLPNGYEESYEEKYFSEDHKNWYLNPDLKLFKLICDDVKNRFDNKKPISILDAGCGKGDFLKFCKNYLRDRSVGLYGIDLVENHDPGISFFTGDFLSFPIKENFDVIVSMMVAEHIPHLNIFMKRIRELLKPRGIIVLVTINSSGFIYFASDMLRRIGARGPFERLYDHHHLQHFTFKSFEELMKKSGLTIVSHRAHNFPLAAVDLPKVNNFLKAIYFMGVAAIFTLTKFNGGISQTIICKHDS